MKKKLATLMIAACVLAGGCGSEAQEKETESGNVSEKQEKDVADSNSDEENSLTSDGEEKKTNKSSGSVYFSEMPDSEENILKNIGIVGEKSKDGKVVVFVTNNNEYVIPDMELQVLFKKGEKIVDTGEDGHDVLVPGNTVVSSLDAPEDYDNFEISASVDWEYGAEYRNWIYNLNIESNIGEDGVVIQFENAGEIDIEELEYIVVYYKNGKIVQTSYEEDVYDFKSGKKIVEKSDTYGTKFDEYEVYINQAHTFSEENTGENPVKESLPKGIGKETMKYTK